MGKTKPPKRLDLTKERRREPFGHPEERKYWKNPVGVTLKSLPTSDEVVKLRPKYKSNVITPDDPVNKKLAIFKGRLLALMKARNRPDALEFYRNEKTGTYYLQLFGNRTGKKVFRVTDRSVVRVLDKLRMGKI